MREIKLASWNVNSLKARLEHLQKWLTESQVDLLGLQELKMTDDVFPLDAIQALGYGAVFAGQKTYNGVAILYKKSSMPEPADVLVNLPSYPDEQKRVIGATFGDLRFVSAYCVNGSEIGSDKFAYKLGWYNALIADCANWINMAPHFALVGDFNIAPDDRDVHDPVAWSGKVLCSEDERVRFQKILDLGLADSFRLFEQPEKTFSWWDYRQLGFQKNRGLRIDHVLLSNTLRANCLASVVDRAPRKWEKPSDHAPVVATIQL